MRRVWGWLLVVATYGLTLGALASALYTMKQTRDLELQFGGDKEIMIFSLFKRMTELELSDSRILEVDSMLREASQQWANIPPGAIISSQRLFERKRYYGFAKDSLATTESARKLAKELIEAHATKLSDPVFLAELRQLQRYEQLELQGIVGSLGGAVLALALFGVQFALEKRQLIEPPKFARLSG